MAAVHSGPVSPGPTTSGPCSDRRGRKSGCRCGSTSWYAAAANSPGFVGCQPASRAPTAMVGWPPAVVIRRPSATRSSLASGTLMPATWATTRGRSSQVRPLVGARPGGKQQPGAATDPHHPHGRVAARLPSSISSPSFVPTGPTGMVTPPTTPRPCSACSSRQIERRCHEEIAFKVLAASRSRVV
jgi:hypothetical protein